MWTNNNKKKSNKKSGSNSEAEEFLETLDFIEIWIDRIERDISNLDTVANSAYKSFSKRNSTLSQEFGKVSEEINRQQQAYNAYMAKANSLGLSWDYINKIQNGTLQIEDIRDEGLNEKIEQYQEFYEKALDCRDAIYELNETLGDLAQAKFDNVASEYDAQLSEIEHRINNIEHGLEMVEAKGNFASKSYYEMLMSTEQENISMLQKEYAALQSAFNEAMSSGAIEQYSESWYDMRSQINDVEEALGDAQKALIEYKNEMREMDWQIFEKQQEYLGNITNESDFIRELLSLNENDLFNKDTGKLTDKGITTGGLHAMDYNVYMAQADEYRNKVEEINKELASDPYNTTLIDKKNEYLEAQRESILNANEEKKAVQDLIEESYSRMLDILQELIDKRKEALQAEKDLYDYEKNIKEQTKNITDIEKQLTALKGDDSEEAKSKRQELESSLEQAKSDLEETEYDQWLSDQEKLLDDLYTQYEEVLNERLDNIDGLMMDMIDSTNQNSEMINNTINSATGDVGYKITDEMKNIWDTTNTGIGKVVSDYSSTFSSTLSTTNNYVKQILELISKTVAKAEEEKHQNTNPGSGGSGGGGGSSGGGGSGGSGSGGSAGGFFRYKADSYPKNKLRTETSIVDRLKYHNFDSSWSARKSYYSAMGLSGTYTGSASQNVNMINWMKRNGYAKGGQIGDLIQSTGETGFALVRKGEYVLTKDQFEIADRMISDLIDFAKYQPKTGSIANTSTTSNNMNGDIVMNFNLPNVKDSKDFLRVIQTDKAVQKAIQSAALDSAMGKNSLNINRFK